MDRDKFIRRAAIFWGLVFLFAYLYVVVFQRTYVRGWPLTVSLVKTWSVLAVGIILALPLVWRPLIWLQPLVFFAVVPVSMGDGYVSLYSLGFYLVAIFTLFRLGFFERHRVIKLIIVLLYLFVVEFVFMLINGHIFFEAISPVFFSATLLVFLYLSFSDRLTVFLKEPKPKVSLKERGLSPAERLYVFSAANGNSIKGISSDYEIAESTVRNTLAHSYKKLGVADATSFAVLVATKELVE
ncbi:MAG: helix-turn-helix transcriptional regulator [Rectinemataceae bacterium]